MSVKCLRAPKREIKMQVCEKNIFIYVPRNFSALVHVRAVGRSKNPKGVISNIAQCSHRGGHASIGPKHYPEHEI